MFAYDAIQEGALKLKDGALAFCRDHPVWTGALTVSGVVVLVMTRRKPHRGLRLSHGSMVEPGFEEVKRVFEENLKSGLEPGGAFAAYYKGKLVVNLFGGYADEDADVTWSQETVTCTFSATKLMNGIVAGILVDRGLLCFDEPVALYWPEFKQHGKEKVTVGQLLSHQAGCPILTQDWSLSLLSDDPDTFSRMLAEQKPLWKPGSAYGYHLLTIGHYFDQLVRRVDPKKRGIQQFFQEEVATPFGIDYWIGLPETEQYKAARIHDNFTRPGWSSVPPREFFVFAWKEMTDGYNAWRRHVAKGFTNKLFNHPEWRKAPDSACQGFSSAFSAAKLCGILSSKNSEVEILSKKSLEKITIPFNPEGEDLHLHAKIRWGPGAFVVECSHGNKPFSIFGGLGYGGQMHVVDPHFQLGFAYVSNYLNPYSHIVVDPRYASVKNALYKCVQKLENTNGPIVGEFLRG